MTAATAADASYTIPQHFVLYLLGILVMLVTGGRIRRAAAVFMLLTARIENGPSRIIAYFMLEIVGTGVLVSAREAVAPLPRVFNR